MNEYEETLLQYFLSITNENERFAYNMVDCINNGINITKKKLSAMEKDIFEGFSDRINICEGRLLKEIAKRSYINIYDYLTQEALDIFELKIYISSNSKEVTRIYLKDINNDFKILYEK